MGKCASKPTLKKEKTFSTEEDRIISQFEKLAPFNKLKLDKVETVFEKHQFEQRLTMPDLRSALNELGLDHEQLKNPNSHFSKYFEAMLESDRLFYQRKLVLSAILTSKEEDSVKINLMKKYYDLNKNDEISRSELEILLKEIIDVSMRIIPMMAVRDSFSADDGLISVEQMEGYTFNMDKVNKSYAKKLMKKIMKNEDYISLEVFHAAFEKGYVKVILNSSAVRKKIRMMFKKKVNESAEI